MKTTAVIVDDEERARKALTSLVASELPQVELLGTADSLESGIQLVKAQRPVILFLDIELGDRTGFELLEALGAERPHVIFTTAHEGYAVKAIRFNALDYLLKPIVPTELDDAVNKAMTGSGRTAAPDNIPALLGSVVSERQMALPVTDGLVVVQMDEMLYCKSDDNYTEVYMRTEKKPYVISRPLSEFDAFLQHQGFVRIHQSYLINRKHIKRYIKGEGGEVIMANDAHLPVSRRQKAALMEALERI